MVVGFTTTYTISADHHWCCEFESRSERGIQHYVIKFVSDVRQVGGYLRELWFPPLIKLTWSVHFLVADRGCPLNLGLSGYNTVRLCEVLWTILGATFGESCSLCMFKISQYDMDLEKKRRCIVAFTKGNCFWVLTPFQWLAKIIGLVVPFLSHLCMLLNLSTSWM